jgi:DNA polymerase-4
LKKLNQYGIYTISDFKELTLGEAEQYFGKIGIVLYNLSRGKGNTKIISMRERKSLGYERTLSHDLITKDEIEKEVYKMTRELSNTLIEKNKAIKTVTLKLKYIDHSYITRSKKSNFPLMTYKEISDVVSHLLLELTFNKKVRLLGVGGSDLLTIHPTTKIVKFIQIKLKLEYK